MTDNDRPHDQKPNPLTILRDVQQGTDSLVDLLETDPTNERIVTDLLRVQGILAKVQYQVSRRVLRERRQFPATAEVA